MHYEMSSARYCHGRSALSRKRVVTPPSCVLKASHFANGTCCPRPWEWCIVFICISCVNTKMQIHIVSTDFPLADAAGCAVSPTFHFDPAVRRHMASSTNNNSAPSIAQTAEIKGRHIEVDYGGMVWLGVISDVRHCVEVGELEYLVDWGWHRAPTWVLQDAVSFVDMSAGRRTRGSRHTSAKAGDKPTCKPSGKAAGRSVPALQRDTLARDHPELLSLTKDFSDTQQFSNRPLPLHAYSSNMGIRGSRGLAGLTCHVRRPVRPALTPPAKFSKERHKHPAAKLARMLESTLL